MITNSLGKLNDVLTKKMEQEEEDEQSDLDGEELDPEAEVYAAVVSSMARSTLSIIKLDTLLSMSKVPGLVKSKKRRQREEYQSWKEQVIQSNKPGEFWRVV